MVITLANESTNAKKILVSILLVTCLLCASLIALGSNQILFKYTFLSIGSKKWNFCPIENRFRGGGDACVCLKKKRSCTLWNNLVKIYAMTDNVKWTTLLG